MKPAPRATGRSAPWVKRRGFGVIEVVIVVLLVGVVAGMVAALSVRASATTSKTLASEDASRAMLLAGETIGLDLRRAVVSEQSPDLVAAADGRGLSFKMATTKYQNWAAPSETVSYELQPVKRSALHQLVRVTAAGRRPIPGCLLSGVLFQVRAPGKSTPWRQTVLVTLVSEHRTLQIEIPVSISVPPPAYPWPPPGKGNA